MRGSLLSEYDVIMLMEYKLEYVKVKNLGYRYSFVGDMCVLWAALHVYRWSIN